MIKATIKATGAVLYLFESKSEPGTWHRTTIAGCSCKGYTHHGHCWHAAKVAELTNAARIEAFRLVAGWLAQVERRAAVQRWNDAAVAETEAAFVQRYAPVAKLAYLLVKCASVSHEWAWAAAKERAEAERWY